MHATDQVVLAVSKTAAEIEDAEARVKEFKNQNDNSHLQKQDACVQMESLDTLKLLDKICLLLHETSFLF